MSHPLSPAFGEEETRDQVRGSEYEHVEVVPALPGIGRGGRGVRATHATSE